MKNDYASYQVTVRMKPLRYPRVHHLLSQISYSQSDLILMLAEQAVKMGNLENVPPHDILNGTCYAGLQSKSGSQTASPAQPDSVTVENESESDPQLESVMTQLI